MSGSIRVKSDRSVGYARINAAVCSSRNDDKETILAGLARPGASPAEAKILSAGLAIREGDATEGIRLLRQLMPRLSRLERGPVVDYLASLLSGSKDVLEAERLLDSHEPFNSSESALFSANYAVIYAMLRDSDKSEGLARHAYDTIQEIDDAYTRMTVLFRLGRAALFRGKGAEAVDFALRSARVASTVGVHRLVAVAYGLAHDAASALADPGRSLLYAKRMTEHGQLSGDVSTTIYGIVSQMSAAAWIGDEVALGAATLQYQQLCVPRQFSEDFSAALAMALPLAWRGDFAAFENAINLLPDYPDEAALTLRHALMGLCAVVRGDIAAARVASRHILHRTSPPQQSVGNAFEQPRRLARTIAAFVCIRIGDVHRGKRVLRSKDLAGSGESSIVDPTKVTKAFVGFSKLLEAAVRCGPAHNVLTPSQTELIRQFAVGMSIPEIARDTARSPATLRAQAHQINVRLGVKGRARAVARARELRIV